MVEFFAFGQGEDADDRPFLAGRRHERAVVVDGDAGEGGLVCLDDGHFFHLVQIVQEHVSAYGFFRHGFGDVRLGLGVCGARTGFLVVGQGEEVVFGVGREGADAAGVEGGDLLVE